MVRAYRRRAIDLYNAITLAIWEYSLNRMLELQWNCWPSMNGINPGVNLIM